MSLRYHVFSHLSILFSCCTSDASLYNIPATCDRYKFFNRILNTQAIALTPDKLDEPLNYGSSHMLDWKTPQINIINQETFWPGTFTKYHLNQAMLITLNKTSSISAKMCISINILLRQNIMTIIHHTLMVKW